MASEETNTPTCEDCTSVGHFWTCCLPDKLVTISNFVVSIIAFGSEHCLFVTEQGSVYSFGKGEYGQLGLGDTRDHLNEPQCIDSLPDIVSVCCGPQFSAALSSRGKVYMWGDNSSGQCGLEGPEKVLVPTAVDIYDSRSCERCGKEIVSMVAINKISCGAFHTLAISSDYELWTWGRELKLGLTKESLVYPRRLEFLKDKKVLSVSCGSSHSLAVVEASSVAVIDSNGVESSTNPSNICATCKISSNSSDTESNICPFGLPITNEIPSEISSVKSTNCLEERGTDIEHSKESYHTISDNSSLENFFQASEGDDILLKVINKARTSDLTLCETDHPVEIKQDDVDEISPIRDVAVIPVEHSEYLSSIPLSGSRRSSLLLDQQEAKEYLVRQFCDLDPEYHQGEVLKSTVETANGETSDWDKSFMKGIVNKVKMTVDKFNFVAIGHRLSDSFLDSSNSSQESFEVLEVEGTGSLSAIIDDLCKPMQQAGSLKSILEAKHWQKQKIRKGSLESLIPGYVSKREANRRQRRSIIIRPCVQTEVWAWGEGTHGKLGHGDELDRIEPCCIKSLIGQGVVRVVAGYEHSIALTADCQVYSWGRNDCGQLGHSLNSKQVLSPKLIELSQHLVWDIAAGTNHTLFLADVRTPQISLFYCGSHDSAVSSVPCSCLKRKGLLQLNILKKSGLVTRVFAGGPYSGCVVNQQGVGEMPVLHEFAATERRYLNHMQTVLVKVLKPLLKDSLLPQDVPVLFSEPIKMLIGQFAEMVDAVAVNAYDLTLLVQGKCNLNSVHILENEEDWLELYLNYVRTLGDVISLNAVSACGKYPSSTITSVARNILGDTAVDQKIVSDLIVQLLHIPVKRIKDYVRLFTRMEAAITKQTPPKDLHLTITVWRQVSETTNRKLHLAENTKAFWENAPQKLLDMFRAAKRRVIRDSRTVPLNLSSSGRFSSHLFILFSDVFVHSQFGSVQSYPLQLIWVDPVPDTSNHQNSITLTTPEDILTLTCPSSHEKTDWVCALNQSIKKILDDDKGIEDSVSNITHSHRRLSPPLARQASYTFAKIPVYRDARYSGMWLCGKLHGHGQILWPDGHKYIGKFNQNMQHGEGLFMVPHNDSFIIYEGYWKEGKQNGLGSVRYPNGDLYEGYFKDGYRHGHGVLKLGQVLSSAASVYIGQWVNNRRQGYGVMDDIRSGEKYMGMWQDDCRHGSGMVVTIDGIYYEGTFVMDKLSGFGVMMFEDNTCFEGELGPGGMLNGKGTLYLSNGDKIEGCFTGKCTDSIKINGVYNKAQNSPSSLSSLADKKKTKVSSFGQLCVPADKKWEDIFGHCRDMLGVQGINPKADTEKAWEAVAVAISKRKKELQSKKRPQLNQEDIDALERIPKTGLGLEKLTFSDYKEIEKYLFKAADCHFHPVGLLVEGLVDVYRATYLGVGAHPRLLSHAVAEIYSFVKRMYSIVRVLFPGLPPPDQPLPLSSSRRSSSEEFLTLAEVEKEANSDVVTPASLLHPILLPRIYPPLFTLYALYNEKEDEKYWERLLKWNKQSDIALMTFLGVDTKFWVMSDSDDIREHRKSFSKVKDVFFSAAVETLQYISTAFTALEKLKIIHQTFGEINKEVQKKIAAEFLWTMDYLFPVFQYVVVRARIRHLGSEIQLIDDLMESHLQHGELGIMFTTLKACYFQIRSEKIANN